MIHLCGRLLLGVAEHSVTERSTDTANSATNHWLFEHASEESSEPAGVITDKNHQGVATMVLLQQLVSILIDFGLSIYPRSIQLELQSLIIQLTRDSPPLVSYVYLLLASPSESGMFKFNPYAVCIRFIHDTHGLTCFLFMSHII